VLVFGERILPRSKFKMEQAAKGVASTCYSFGTRDYESNFLKTNAEFFEPNAMQLHSAVSMRVSRPTLGT